MLLIMQLCRFKKQRYKTMTAETMTPDELKTMVETITKLSEQGLKAAKEFFANNMKNESYDEEACVFEAFEVASGKAIEGNSASYELGGFFTKSGNPILLDFTESDFEYEDIDDA